ncbi:sprouty-related, EVH1 domain-containing protein 1-like [Heterodontus francisci]|uniref:sprouty-related, EVH1 domain-containing protein 1-like n=1 Tax=Heterodontus francisci TaxID=7792 RepID=UPI00355AF35C
MVIVLVTLTSEAFVQWVELLLKARTKLLQLLCKYLPWHCSKVGWDLEQGCVDQLLTLSVNIKPSSSIDEVNLEYYLKNRQDNLNEKKRSPPPPFSRFLDLSVSHGDLCFSNSYVVRVRAVVMTRDDSSGGWVPLGGAGLSHVMICKVAHSDESSQNSFLIRGERLRDQAMILECGLKKDLIYNKVNPIFHHWKVDDDKFGLTFQSPADAVTFERSIKNAIEELAEGSLTSCSSSEGEADAVGDTVAVKLPAYTMNGLRGSLSDRGQREESSDAYQNWEHYTWPQSIGEKRDTAAQISCCKDIGCKTVEILWPFAEMHTDSESSSNSRKEMLPKHITIVTSESSSSCYIRSPASDEFRLGQTQAAAQANQVQTRPLQHGGYRDTDDLESVNPCKDPWVAKGYEDYRRAIIRSRDRDADKIDLCVHFAKGEVRESGHGGGSGGSPGTECPLKEVKGSPACKVHARPSPQLKKVKEPVGLAEEDMVPSRCVYCRDVFRDQENGRGQCQDAPDPIERCVYQVSCMWCAESMLYHCMSDSEGNYSDPCSCDASSRHFCARWLALAALSLMAPCMCCYLPLRACHRCGERWGCCGGKHKAVR